MIFQAASAMALILVLSLYLIRRLAYEFFLKLHFILAFITVLALLKHVSHLGSLKSIFQIAALSLWGVNTILRFMTILYYNTGRIPFRDQATISHYQSPDQK